MFQLSKQRLRKGKAEPNVSNIAIFAVVAHLDKHPGGKAFLAKPKSGRPQATLTLTRDYRGKTRRCNSKSNWRRKVQKVQFSPNILFFNLCKTRGII